LGEVAHQYRINLRDNLGEKDEAEGGRSMEVGQKGTAQEAHRYPKNARGGLPLLKREQFGGTCTTKKGGTRQTPIPSQMEVQAAEIHIGNKKSFPERDRRANKWQMEVASRAEGSQTNSPT